MKTLNWIVLGLFFVACTDSSLAQNSVHPSQITREMRAGEKVWRAKQREAHQTTWETYHFSSNAITGRIKIHTNAFVELGTSLNVKAEDGTFQPADPSFKITERGAEAHGTAHKLILAPDIAVDGAIHVIDPQGTSLKSHPLGLGYFDPLDGASVVIATISDGVGWLVAPNVVVYSNCFDGIRASMLYKNSKTGISQDLIFHEKPAPPEDYGLSEFSRLEVFSEFLDGTPLPVKTDQVLRQETDPVLRAVMEEPDIKDSTLSFGKMTIGPGKAFSIDAIAGPRLDQGTRVYKQYEIIDGRNLLIEGVEHWRIRSQLDTLPRSRSGSIKNAAIDPIQPINRLGRPAVRILPEKQLAQIKATTLRLAASVADSKYSIFMNGPAFVLDYEEHSLEFLTDFTFSGRTNYLINGLVALDGTTVFEGGTILKYKANSDSSLYIFAGPIVCKTEPYLPAIFTAEDDNSVGEVMPGSTGNPSGYYAAEALFLFNDVALNLKHLRISHVTVGINFFDSTLNHTISHVQVRNCMNVFVWFRNLKIRNALICDTENAVFYPSYGGVLQAEHLTVDGAVKLVAPQAQLDISLANSLIVEASGDSQANYPASASTIWLPDGTGVFQTVGLGAHYLSTDVYRNHPNAASISDPDFLNEIEGMTTYPPIVEPANSISADTEWAPVETFADDDNYLDLGYHYPIIHYLSTGLAVQDKTLTIKDGTVVGFQYSSLPYGMKISSGILKSVGTPLAPNRFLQVHTVQEQAGSILPYNYSLFTDGPFNSHWSAARFRFTDFAALAGPSYFFYGGSYLGDFEMCHSQLHNGNIAAWFYGLAGRSIGWTNNLFENVSFELSADLTMSLHVYNNLFKAGKFLLNQGTTSWEFRNNIFDHGTINTAAPVGNSHNVFVGHSSPGGFVNSGQSTFLSGLTYQAVGSRKYYLPQISSIVNAGDRLAASVGLYHFTTSANPNQALEGNSVVDIGFHYGGLNSNGLPIDSDQDGLSDVLEDGNGNGLTDNGEASYWDPVITLSGGSMTYFAGLPAKVIDGGATVADQDSSPTSGFLAGGNLSVQLVVNQQPDDILGIRHQTVDSSVLEILEDTSEVLYNGQPFATYFYDFVHHRLDVTFTSSSTLPAVQALLRSISYHNSSDIPVQADRIVQLQISDGVGGLSDIETKTISVTCATAMDVMLLIDNSQSMPEPDFEVAKLAAQNFIGKLRPGQDRVGVEKFAGTSIPVFDLGFDLNAASAAVGLIASDGNGTLLTPPVEAAKLALLEAQPPGRDPAQVVRTIIVFSDGIIRTSPAEEHRQSATNMAKSAENETSARIIAIGYDGITVGQEIPQQVHATARNFLKNLSSSRKDAHGSTIVDFYHAPSAAGFDAQFVKVADALCLDNAPPAVAITSPGAGTLFPGSQDIPLEATASDNDGTVAKVEFYYDGVLIGEDSTSPYAIAWHSVPLGSHLLTAKATDDAGASSASIPVLIIVNSPPVVSAGSPVTTLVGVPIQLNGAADDDGNPLPLTIAWAAVSGPELPNSVDFSNTGLPATSANFNKPGTYLLKLSASDSIFDASSTVTVTVRQNQTPVVSAGPDHRILPGETVVIQGSAFDDGLVNSSPTYSWKEIINKNLENPEYGPQLSSALELSALLSVPGTYYYRFEASDGQLEAFDVVLVTVANPNTRTWTRNVDFAEGFLVNLNYDDIADQLQINEKISPFPFVNIACTGNENAPFSRGTVARIDARSGRILGEYRTAPDAVVHPSPSRTTVDRYGNCWVANRHDNQSDYRGIFSGSVTRIGLVVGGTRTDGEMDSEGRYIPNLDGQYLAPPFLYNTCIDKDADGLIRTSRGVGNILPWSQPSGHGRIFIVHDANIWTDENMGASGAPNDAGEFAINVGRWLAGKLYGEFLIYSGNGGLTGDRFFEVMNNYGGHTLFNSINIAFTLENLLSYDAVFLAGTPADNNVLINYVKAGGSVLLAGGTGNGMPPQTDTTTWNSFLEAFGLRFEDATTINGSFDPVSTHQTVGGVEALQFNSGSPIQILDPRSPHTKILETIEAPVGTVQVIVAIYEKSPTGDEALDEAIINHVRVLSPEARTIAVDRHNNVWVGGQGESRGGPFVHEKLNGLDGKPFGISVDFEAPGPNACCGGYGGLIDANGVLWTPTGSYDSVRFDPESVPATFSYVNSNGYGVGIDPRTGNIWFSSNGDDTIREFLPDGSPGRSASPPVDTGFKGLAVDQNGNIWVADELYGKVVRFRINDQANVVEYVGSITLGCAAKPSGVAIDLDGKVWVSASDSSNALRIDPNKGVLAGAFGPVGEVDMIVNFDANAKPYNYSDMTGFVCLGATAPGGIWRVVHEGAEEMQEWKTITWTSQTPAGTAVRIEVRAADVESELSGREFVEIEQDEPLPLVQGKFIEIRAALSRHLGVTDTPVLKDLTVSSEPMAPPATDGNPTAHEDIFSVQLGSENNTLDVLANDAFISGDSWVIASVSPTIGLVATIEQDKKLSYTPPNGFVGEDRFVYQIRNGSDILSRGLVRVRVEPTSKTKESLVARDDRLKVFNDGVGVAAIPIVELTRNDADPENQPITIQAFTQPQHGTLVLSSCELNYQPEPNYFGTDFFRYTVTDGAGDSASATVLLEVLQRPAVPQLQMALVNPDGSEIELENGSIVNFGTIKRCSGTPSATRTIKLTNVGESGTLSFSNVGLEDVPPFATLGYFPAVLAQKETKAFQVTFHPPCNTTFGKYSGELSFSVTIPGSAPAPFSIGLEGAVAENNYSAPLIVVERPAPYSWYESPATLTVVADITPQGNTIDHVEFILDSGATRLANQVTPPAGTGGNQQKYWSEWSNVGDGEYVITVAAYDNNNPPRVTYSQPNRIRVGTGNRLPIAMNDMGSVQGYAIGAAVQSVTIPVLLNDRDGDGDNLVIIEFSQGKAGKVAQVGNSLTYTPNPAVYGQDSFNYVISDGKGGNARAYVKVAISQIVPPSVILSSTPSQTSFSWQGRPAQFEFAAVTQGGIQKVEFYLGNQKVGASTSGPTFQYIWTDIVSGTYQVWALGFDVLGEAVAQSAPITINLGAKPNNQLPIAHISYPSEGAVILEGHLVPEGIASDPDGPFNHRSLKVYSPDGELVRTISASQAVPSESPLGSIDLTGVRNGVYDLELEVFDDSDKATDRVRFVLETGLKIGHFTFSQEDLIIPLNGLPLSVVRTYDSMKPAKGDFGNGWTYAIQDLDVEIDEDRIAVQDADNDELFEMRAGGGRNVTLTLPDGRRTTFVFDLVPGPSEDGVPCFCYNAVWKASPGIDASLEPLDSPELKTLFSGLVYWQQAGFHTPVDNFDFQGFILTMGDGTRYVIKREELGSHFVLDEVGGDSFVTAFGKAQLDEIQERSGARIKIKKDRIEHLNPAKEITRSIVFKRDPAGLVTEIFDPTGVDTSGQPTGFALVKYEYSSLGNLARVLKLKDKSDPGNPVYEVTEFKYGNAAHPHYITEIIDPRGLPVALTEYDLNGRMSAVVNAEGLRTEFHHDDAPTPLEPGEASRRDVSTGRERIIRFLDVAQTQATTTIHEYDGRGNIVLGIQDDGLNELKTRRKYDNQNNVRREENPLGNVTATEIVYYQENAQDTARIMTQTVTEPNDVGAPAIRTVFVYNLSGQVTSLTDAKNVVTENVYHGTTGALEQTKVYPTPTSDPLILVDNSYFGDNPGDPLALRGLLKASMDALDNKTVYEYYTVNTPGTGRVGDLERVVQKNAVDVELSKVEFEYDANANRTVERRFRTPPGGGAQETLVTQLRYDAQNRIIVSIDPKGGSSKTVYNDVGRVSSTEDRYGIETHYSYNAQGDLIETVYPDGAIARTATIYEGAHRKVVAQDPHYPDSPANGNRTEHDELGRVIRTERLQNLVIDMEPDANGLYNTVFRTANTISFTETEYDFAGRVFLTRDANGHATSYQYDGNGRRHKVISTVDGKTIEAVSKYDANDNLEASYTIVDGVAQPEAQWTKYEYDAVNRRTRILLPLLAGQTLESQRYTRTTVYDDLGRRVAEIDPNGITTGFEYDGLGRLTAVTNAFIPSGDLGFPGDMTLTRYRYDEVGSLVEQWDANQSVLNGTQWTFVANPKSTKFEYDKLGRRTKRTLPAGGVPETWVYDPPNLATPNDPDDILNVVIDIDFNGTSVEMEYDSRGRLQRRTPSSATMPPEGLVPVSFTYTATGRRETMIDASGLTVYLYEGHDRLWRKMSPAGMLTYDYDDNGNVIRIESSNPGGTVLTYDWDSLNRLKEVNPATSGSVAYNYDDFGNLQRVTLPPPNSVISEYHYDFQHRLTDMEVRKGANPPMATFNYNPLDRPLGLAAERRALRENINGITREVDYQQDKLYRLVSEHIRVGSPGGQIAYDSSPGYSDASGYDRVGNRHSRSLNEIIGGLETKLPPVPTYLYDANDRLDRTGDGQFGEYDANGNTRQGEAAFGQTANDLFDFENRLIRRTTAGGVVEIVYDGDGNRVKKTVGGVTTFYLVDDRNPTGYAQVLEEFEDISDTPPAESLRVMTRRYGYGHDLLWQERNEGTVWQASFYGYDGHGSVRFLTDANGTITDTYTYDAFGSMIGDSHLGIPTPNHYLYAGKQFDEELGLYYNRARYLDPNTGRFWTTDIFEGNQSDPLSLHKYLYAHANPVNGRDPSGHSFILEFTITTAKRAGIAAATMGTISAGITYAKTKSLKAAIWQGSKTAGLTGFAFLSPAFAASMLATLPAQVGLAVYNEDLTIKDSPEVAAYIVAAVALNYLFKTQAIPPNPAVVTGILRDASRTGIGNSGVGSATASEVLMAGRAWVGNGFTVHMGGKAWVSANGLRQFRLPSYKPNQGRWQANLEERAAAGGKWTANSHIDIIAGAGPNTALENAAAAGAAISSESDDEDEGY